MDNELFSDEQVEAIELFLMKTASVVDLKAKREHEDTLLHAYKKNPAQSTFMPLYQSYKPMILQAASKNMFGSPIPKAAHVMLAAQNFMNAANRFDASKGAKFRTYMFNTVSDGGKRLNLKYQNIGYIPESRAIKYQAYQTAHYLLRENLKREPSTLELADELAMPPAEIERMRKEIRQDLILNEALPNVGPAFAQSDKAMQVARDLQYALIPKHRAVLEHAVGLNGLTSLTKKSGGSDVQALARATRQTVPEVRSALKTISREMRKHRGEIGSAEALGAEFDPEEVGE